MGRFMLRIAEIRRRSGGDEVIFIMQNWKGKWVDHVSKKRDDRWSKRILKWQLRTDKTERGRLLNHWKDGIKRMSTNWVKTAQDKEKE